MLYWPEAMVKEQDKDTEQEECGLHRSEVGLLIHSYPLNSKHTPSSQSSKSRLPGRPATDQNLASFIDNSTDVVKNTTCRLLECEVPF